MMLWQPPLPQRYTTMSEHELARSIRARRQELGGDLVILGHHYQQDEVIQFADFTGDSFKLSQLAAEQVEKSGAKYVIFCGVHFMAESADILTPDGVAVILPDMSAGCSMADMADYDDTVDAWEQLMGVVGESDAPGRATKRRSDEGAEKTEAAAIRLPLADNPKGPDASLRRSVAASPPEVRRSSVRIIPICYMNSSAAIKAFCGEHGGAVCTSSNCARVFEWALAGGTEPRREGETIKILFLPDQHLGRNTAASLGYDVVTDMCTWDPKDPAGLGGSSEDEIERSTFILWKGHCSVHKLFRPEHVDQIRGEWPDVTVIVHPECSYEVVQKADITGSTEGIIKALESAAPGSHWAIGTEVHLVDRLCRQAAERGVEARILSSCQCLCTTMYRIDMPHLLWVMDNLAEGKVVNQVRVPEQVRHWALVSMNRMLELVGSGTLKGAPGPAAEPAGA